MDLRGSQSSSNARRYPEPTRATANSTALNQKSESNNANKGIGENMMDKSPNKKYGIVIVGVIVVLIILAILGWMWHGMANNDQSKVKSSQYQAVFLTNGQVYFGKLTGVDSKYLDLNDIFYLQVQQQVQPSSGSNNNNNNNSQVSLAKLGNELHAPEDNMYISRDQVLFWENLKDSGKVAQAIKTYQQQNNK